MPGFLMPANTIMTCAHLLGAAKATPTQTRVFVNNQPVLVMRDQITVKGCPFTVPGPKPQPCVLIRWQMPSTKVIIDGQPAMLVPSIGLGPAICQSAEQIPQGPPLVIPITARVMAI